MLNEFEKYKKFAIKKLEKLEIILNEVKKLR
jgi:hypothetical protein